MTNTIDNNNPSILNNAAPKTKPPYRTAENTNAVNNNDNEFFKTKIANESSEQGPFGRDHDPRKREGFISLVLDWQQRPNFKIIQIQQAGQTDTTNADTLENFPIENQKVGDKSKPSPFRKTVPLPL